MTTPNQSSNTFDISQLTQLIDDMEIVAFVPAVDLSANEVVFCISDIADVESTIAKSGKQWKLTIHYITEDDNGEATELTRYLSLGHTTSRDKDIAAIQNDLRASADGRVHSFRLGMKKAVQSTIKRYGLFAVRDNGQLLCECEHS